MIDIIVGYYSIFVLVRDSTSIVNIKTIFNSENVLVSVIFFPASIVASPSQRNSGFTLNLTTGRTNRYVLLILL